MGRRLTESDLARRVFYSRCDERELRDYRRIALRMRDQLVHGARLTPEAAYMLTLALRAAVREAS